jgi:hypothetical protein
MAKVDDQIDELYQLRPGEFTAARTRLAKTLSGPEAAAVKALKKPVAVPWAVNQLYWRDRRTYQRLLDTGRALRAAQVAALEGRKADVREASVAHRAAIAEAASRASALAHQSGVQAKPEALARMLEAVSLAREQPGRPGRFTEVLQPAAFEALAGLVPRPAAQHPRGGVREAESRDERDEGAGGSTRSRKGSHEPDRDAKGQREARAAEHRRVAEEAAEKRRRDHERRVERQALESAVAKAERQAERAHTALAAAKQAAVQAERDAAAADRALDEAQRAMSAFEKGER